MSQLMHDFDPASAHDFSAPIVPIVRPPAPGAGRPGGAPFDDLFEIMETGDPTLPRVAAATGGALPGYGELELSVMHSYMPRYRALSTGVGYEQGQRLFYSSPEVQRLRREGVLSIEGSCDQGRLVVAAMLERDLRCKLTPAENHQAFYVDPRANCPTAVKRILYGMTVGVAIQQAFEVYLHANPFLQDHLPPAVRFAEKGIIGTDLSQDHLRKLLYQMPRYFIVGGSKWPSGGRVVTTPMRVGYKAALLAGWSTGQMWLLRALIESGARLSEVVALTILDWLDASDGGDRCNAINKGSRGRIWKEIGWTPDCAGEAAAYVDDERFSPIESKRYGRRLKLDDFRELRASGRLDECRVPIVPTRTGAAYTRDGIYNHVWSPTLGPLGLRGHDTRHDFVSRNLDRIYAAYWQDEHLLTAACEALMDYMAWSTRELMLFVYSRRHRQHREALLRAGFHHYSLADEAAAALKPGLTPLPATIVPGSTSSLFDDWMTGL